MLLIGNVNVENTDVFGEGMKGKHTVSFILPSRLRKRHKLKVKYFGFGASHGSHITDRNKSVDVGDNAELESYAYLAPVKEVRMEVRTEESSVMHANTILKSSAYVDNEQQEHEYNVNYLSYPATTATDAISHNGSITYPNSPFTPFAVSRGYSQVHNLNIGYAEENTAKIDVVLSAEGVSMVGTSTAFHSFTPNVKMDTISFVLELL